MWTHSWVLGLELYFVTFWVACVTLMADQTNCPGAFFRRPARDLFGQRPSLPSSLRLITKCLNSFHCQSFNFQLSDIWVLTLNFTESWSLFGQRPSLPPPSLRASSWLKNSFHCHSFRLSNIWVLTFNLNESWSLFGQRPSLPSSLRLIAKCLNSFHCQSFKL